MGTIEENLKLVNWKIADACSRCGRDPADIRLVAVSKTWGPEFVKRAHAAGQLHFGENKIQEAESKIPEVGQGPVWHLVGHLQTNKVKKAIRLFKVIESVDSFKLAETISKQCLKEDITIKILLEVNSAGEASKFGLEPDEIPATAEKVNKLDNLELEGIMTVGPLTDDTGVIDRAFGLTQALFNRLQETCGSKIKVLSMGMTGDFERAIEFGSTELRIGTAIFGSREYI